MTIYIVTDMRGGFIAAFRNEEDARRYILKQPGRFNMHNIEETELQ